MRRRRLLAPTEGFEAQPDAFQREPAASGVAPEDLHLAQTGRSGQDDGALLKLDPGVHHEECGQQGEGGSPSPLHCPGEAPSAVLCPVLGSPVPER